MIEVIRVQLALGEALVGFAQVSGEGDGAVAVDPAVESLDLIQGGAHLFPAERRVVEKVDEVLDRLLEVNVVFPERVIAVEDQDRHRPLSIDMAGRAGPGRWTANRNASRMGPP